MNINVKVAAALLLTPLVTAAAHREDYAAPYRTLKQANRDLNPALAASAYAAGGRLIFEHPAQPGEMFQGKSEIEQAYVRTFGQVDPGTPIELDFRFESPGLVSDRHSGAYRLSATIDGKPITMFGRFSVKVVKERGSWRFSEDRGSIASRADFDRLPRWPDSAGNS